MFGENIIRCDRFKGTHLEEICIIMCVGVLMKLSD